MKLKQNSNLILLGKGQILKHLQTSISNATKSILIVGPWLDAYFTRKIIDSLPNSNIPVSFIVRVEEDGTIDTKTLSALNLARNNIENFQARSLKKLHSKVILIDDDIFYLGSANWYWYSLHESLEVTITGKINQLPLLLKEVSVYWESSTSLPSEDLKDHMDTEPVKTHNHSSSNNTFKKII